MCGNWHKSSPQILKKSMNLKYMAKICTFQQYLSSVSPFMPISSVTVAREQLSFLRLCFWLTGSAWRSGWVLLHASFSGLGCVWPLVFVWGEEAWPLSCICSLGPCASADSGEAASKLCLLMVFLRSLATFSTELFLFRARVCSSPTSSPSDRNRGAEKLKPLTQMKELCKLKHLHNSSVAAL